MQDNDLPQIGTPMQTDETRAREVLAAAWTRCSPARDASIEDLDAAGRERFWRLVSPADSVGCRLWRGYIVNGYGRFCIRRYSVSAHRVALILSSGHIEPSQVVDHKCRNRACVNPSHLRAVSVRVNSTENSVSVTARNAAKTHCVAGHAFVGSNVIAVPGGRECRECKRRRNRERKARIRAHG